TASPSSNASPPTVASACPRRSSSSAIPRSTEDQTMSWGSPFFVLAIIAISTIGWVMTTLIRARHGYPVENEWGGKAVHPIDNRAVDLLEAENAALKGKLLRVEERVAVL